VETGQARAAPATPVPRHFYVHDDLTDEVQARFGAGSPVAVLTAALMDLVRRDTARVRVITVEQQIQALVARGDHRPFALALAIGRAGERVAGQLHARTGWFPTVRRVDLAREEDDGGGYRVVSPGGAPLAEQLAGVAEASSLALVDDTVFSGLTMRTVLTALPPSVRARTHAFCLRCVAETLAAIASLCPITTGLAAPGRLLEDVSFINASGLVRRGAIRRAGQPPLAFFERPAWMHAWFPGHADEVIEICRRLNGLLEPVAAGTPASPG
jgi:hypothetical protein